MNSIPHPTDTMPALHRLSRIAAIVPVLAALALSAAGAQTLDGVVVVGPGKSAVGRTKVALLDRRQNIVDTVTTDVFGEFTLRSAKPGKFALLVRRAGFYPIVTDNFELLKDETRRDTVVLAGKAAEKSVREVIGQEVRNIFGTQTLAGMQRFLGPDEIEKLREHAFSLGDLVRSGRLAGLSWINPPSGCLRFSGARGCAQIFLDGLPVNIRVDQVSGSDIEAIVAFRDTELGLLASSRGAMDNSRFGAVLVYTRRFQIR